MNVKNCRKCGKMFNYVSGMPICPACKEHAEAQFQAVKKYVQDHKTATIPEIVEDCGVDAKQIQQWVREERLFFTEDSPVKINCEICGATISTGRYCDKCKKDTAHNLKDSITPAHVEAPKMPANLGKQSSKMYTYKK